MKKCVYCGCTAAIEPGKDYCRVCGHDAVVHVAAGVPAGGAPLVMKLVIAAAAIVAVYFFMNSQPDGARDVPVSTQTPPAATAPADASGIVPSAPTVYTLPPPTVQPNGQVTPAAPPLGSFQSNPGAAVPDSATPNPGR